MTESENNRSLLLGLIFKVSNKNQYIGDKFYNDISLKQGYVLSVIEYIYPESPTLT